MVGGNESENQALRGIQQSQRPTAVMERITETPHATPRPNERLTASPTRMPARLGVVDARSPVRLEWRIPLRIGPLLLEENT